LRRFARDPSRTFRRVGGVKDLRVNTRIISATNRDLKQAIKEGKFRNDLYYRLQVIPVYLPPLRERKEDIPLLANHFIAMFNKEFKKNVRSISPEVEKLLQRYSWPGNVRELKNIIERAMLLEAEEELLPEHLPPEITGSEEEILPHEGPATIDELYPITLKEMERLVIEKTLNETGQNKSQAAKILGISRQTLREKVKQYRIE